MLVTEVSVPNILRFDEQDKKIGDIGEASIFPIIHFINQPISQLINQYILNAVI